MIRSLVGPLVGLGATCVLVAGCTASPQTSRSDPEITVMRLDRPIADPVWATEHDVVIAADERGDELLKIDPKTGETTAAFDFGSGGGTHGDLIEQTTELLCVPRPEAGQVSLVNTASFDPDGRIVAGPHPHDVSVHPTSHNLIALSADGKTVTGVDIENHKPKFEVHLVRPATAVVAAEDTRAPAFWIVDALGVTHYARVPPKPGETFRAAVTPDTFSPDRDTPPGRAYLAHTGSSVVDAVAVDDEGHVGVASSRRLSHTVDFIESKAKEEQRVFVIAGDTLVVLDSQNLDLLATVDFGAVLAGHHLTAAQVSGMTVGDEQVFLTLKDEPDLVKIEKP